MQFAMQVVMQVVYLSYVMYMQCMLDRCLS